MLDGVGDVSNDARNEHLAIRELGVLPDLPLMLVSWVGGLDGIGASTHLQHQIHDVPQGNIRGVGSVPAAPPNVVAKVFFLI